MPDELEEADAKADLSVNEGEGERGERERERTKCEEGAQREEERVREGGAGRKQLADQSPPLYFSCSPPTLF